jgi:hypothetical protein
VNRPGPSRTGFDGWFRGESLGRKQLHQPPKRAIESAGDVTVGDEHVRVSLLRILDLMDEGGFIVRPGYADFTGQLHRAARLPISSG